MKAILCLYKREVETFICQIVFLFHILLTRSAEAINVHIFVPELLFSFCSLIKPEGYSN